MNLGGRNALGVWIYGDGQGELLNFQLNDDRGVVRAALTATGMGGRERRRKALRQRLMKLLGDIGEDDLRQVHQALTVLHDAAVRRAGERHGNPDPGDKEREG